jgi:hypothetical protein
MLETKHMLMAPTNGDMDLQANRKYDTNQDFSILNHARLSGGE